MCFGKKPKQQYASSSSGGSSEESIRVIKEKNYAQATVSSVFVFGDHEHYPTAVPPPPRQFYDMESRPSSRQSAQGAVPNFSSPQPQGYPKPMSQASRIHSNPQFSGPQGPFPPPHRTHPLQQPHDPHHPHNHNPHQHYHPHHPRLHHRSHPRPSPLAPEGHQRQQGPPYQHVNRKIQGAQGAGMHGGTKLHPMQVMYVGGW